MPDISVNPRLWLQFIDTTGKGEVDESAVVPALEATLPLDTEKLRDAMQNGLWSNWTGASVGRLEEIDFFKTGGLHEWVRGHQKELDAARQRGPAPQLDPDDDAQLDAWFSHWDRSRSQRLDIADVILALLHAAHVSSLEMQRVQRLKAGVEKIWRKYVVRAHCRSQESTAAETQSSVEEHTLSRERFCKSGIATALSKLTAELVEEARSEALKKGADSDPFAA